MFDNFAVCVLSHERAYTQTSYTEIIASGYSGQIWLVVDDADKELEEYKELYPGHVVVFNKEKYAETVDKIYDPGNLNSAVYARAFLYDFAKENCLKYILEVDDDLTDFSYKYVDKNGKFKQRPISNFDEVVEAYLAYMENAPISSINIASAGKYFGGKNGVYKDGFSWNINQMFFLNMEHNIRFRGAFYDDAVALLSEADNRKIMLEFYSVCKNAEVIGTNAGGMNELYKKYDEYCRWFIPFIVEPSKVNMKLVEDGFRANKTTNTAFPKIIRERHRKEAI